MAKFKIQEGLEFADGTSMTTAAVGGGASGPTTVEISSTPPSTPVVGQVYYDSDDGNIYICTDPTGTPTWVDSSPSSNIVPDDTFESKTTATGVVAHDCATNKVFVHSSISANFTANLTNLNLAAGSATNITLILNQGATAYICNALQIGGVAQTIKWQGSSSAPTGNSNKTDVMSFSIFNVAGTYTVLGQLVSFG